MARIIAALAASCCLGAGAQPLTDADITRGTACGAPGVGRVWAGAEREQIQRRDGAARQRVNAEGYWETGCRMPPGPKDCPTRTPVDPWVGDRGHVCHPREGRLLGQRVPFGRDLHTANPAVRDGERRPNQGAQRWECRRGADGAAQWVLARSHCGR